MKIVTIVGARPQFVKAAVVSRAIEKYNAAHPADRGIHESIIHTGQHYDENMSDIFFSQMQIPKPKHHLHIGGKSHGAMTGQMVEKIEAVLLQEKPAVLLVYGDTNSTLAGALAASKLHIPIAHVEAGLRSHNMAMPEEINRVLVDRISQWLFCPTRQAVENLMKEGYDGFSSVAIENVGDVMYDAALFYQEISQTSEYIESKIQQGSYYLATIHRQDNTENKTNLETLVKALGHIAAQTKVIFPLHPRTKKYMEQFSIEAPQIDFIDPVGYFDMIGLLRHCAGVFSDSGGLQKEAYFFKKSCIVLRDQTEWTELVSGGYNKLVGAHYDRILTAENEIRIEKPDFSRMPYGNGHAGEKIVQALVDSLET